MHHSTHHVPFPTPALLLAHQHDDNKHKHKHEEEEEEEPAKLACDPVAWRGKGAEQGSIQPHHHHQHKLTQ